MTHTRCPKCSGTLFYEADLAEGFLIRKCLQCGMIESYYWLERTGKVPVPLEVEREQSVDRK